MSNKRFISQFKSIDGDRWEDSAGWPDYPSAERTVLNTIAANPNIEGRVFDTQIMKIGPAWTRQDLTHTVHCYTDKSLRQHFTSQQAAVKYANTLLQQNHRVKIFPFSPPKKAIDYIAENEEKYR